MAKLRLLSEDEFQTSLSQKLSDGKARLDRMKVEFTASRNTYQGIMQQGSGGVDASMVTALMQTQMMAASDEVRLDSLKLRNLMEGLYSKLCISDPAVTTKAHTRDYENIKAAELAQLVVENIRQSTNLKQVLEKGTYLNTACLGTGVLYVGWNKDGGRVATPAEDIKEMGGDLNGKDIEMEGDYDFRSPAPDDFIIDTASTEFDIDADWCMERRRIPLERAVWAMPEHQEYLQDLAQKLQGTKGPDVTAKEPYHRQQRVSTITVWEYWERAQPWNGMVGAYALFIDDGNEKVKVLRRAENPYSHKQLPYIVLTDIDVEGDPYGLSRSILGQPAQEAINQLFLQVMANVELHGSIRMLWPEGATSDDANDNHPAIRIPYNPSTGEKPTYLQPVSVTSDIWRLHTLLSQELDQLYSSSEFDRGEINRELSSYAVQTAIERSEAKMIRLYNKKKLAIKRTYEQCLSNTIQYATESRMICIAGNEESHNKEFFFGSDLKGNYGVFVDFGQFMPVDPFARKQQILELVKTGIFEKAGGNMQKLVSTLVDGDMLDIRDLFEQAKRVQEEEFMRLIEGEAAPVQPWHEHLSHYSSCAEFTQKKYFESLPQDAKSRIYQHMEEHKTAAAKIQAAAQPQVMGGAPAPGAAGQALPQPAPAPSPKG
jgi:hypothetical protein